MLLSTAFFAIYHLISTQLKTSVVRIRHSSKTMTVSGSTYALESLPLLVSFWSPLLLNDGTLKALGAFSRGAVARAQR